MLLTYSERMKKRIAGDEGELPFGPDEKSSARAFAESIGMDQPRLLAMAKSIDEVDFAALPDRFVVKPDGLHSGHGVHLLTRVGEGRYLDQYRGEEIRVDGLSEEYQNLRARVRPPERFKVIVEEWVAGERGSPPIPFDYKIYAFYGRPKIVLQVNRNIKPTGLGWFDGNFRPLRIGDCFPAIPGKYQLDRLIVPRRWQALLGAARKISVALQTPFARIDLFASDRGPLLGEVTLTPGGAGYSYPFTEAFDRKLGKAWRNAEDRLARDRATASAVGAASGPRKRRNRRFTGRNGGARTQTP